MSNTESDQMTLVDVRDWHRYMQQFQAAEKQERAEHAHKELADAIDAHMASCASAPVATACAPDANVEANRQLLLQRSIAGQAKYGVTTEREDLTSQDWLQHLLEELLDAANYIQAFKLASQRAGMAD